MKWKILNVSIPVYDLNKSKEFYEILLGKNQNDKELYRPLVDNEESVFLGRGGFGLRLYKPKPDLNITKFLQSRRSYISIIVDNIDQIKANLDKNKTSVLPILGEAYGDKDAEMWLQRWRIFFMACAELWGYKGGIEWRVGHYLFKK